MSEQEQIYLWRIELESAPAALWPLVSDTDRFNRACGYPPVERLPPLPQTPSGARRLRARVLGMAIDWVESGFEWIEPRRFSVERHYSNGPVARMVTSCELTARASGGTLITYELRLLPSGLAGRLVLPMTIGYRVRAITTRVLHDFDRQARGPGGPGARPAAAPVAPSSSRDRLSPGGGARLAIMAGRLTSEGRQKPALVAKLAGLLRSGEDDAVSRLRPYALAGAWGIAEVFGWTHSLNERPDRNTAKFYLTYALAHVLGATIVLLSLNLVNVVIDVEVMNALLLPIVLGFLLVLEARALPSEYRMRGPRRFITTTLCLVVVAFGLYLVPATLGWV